MQRASRRVRGIPCATPSGGSGCFGAEVGLALFLSARDTLWSHYPFDLILRSPSEARASRRMAASPNSLPWLETARIAAKCTQAAPAMARLLTMRPGVLERDI